MNGMKMSGCEKEKRRRRRRTRDGRNLEKTQSEGERGREGRTEGLFEGKCGERGEKAKRVREERWMQKLREGSEARRELLMRSTESQEGGEKVRRMFDK